LVAVSDRDAFKSHASALDGSFCEASAEESGARFVVGCEVADPTAFKLSMYDLTRQRLAERENTFEMTDRTRAMHRIATWSEYFALVQQAFKKGTVLAGDDGKTLTIILYLAGRQVSLKFDLLPVDAEFLKKKAAQLVLRMLHVARRVFELEDEVGKLRAELEQARRAPVSPSGPAFDSLDAHAAGAAYGSPRAHASRSPMRVGGMLPGGAAAARAAAPPKRQPGFSIVNPRSRRRVLTGAKLASASGAAGAASTAPREGGAEGHRGDGDPRNDEEDDDATEER
jgi:hypothetical protein